MTHPAHDSRRGRRISLAGPAERATSSTASGRSVMDFGSIRAPRNLLMVGGGYGVAPLVGLGERAMRSGASVAMASGGRHRGARFPDGLAPTGDRIPGGDRRWIQPGHYGYVTDLVPERITWADAVYACGPLPMMAALSTNHARAAPRKPGQVAMEERMGCAMGVCLGCCVETKRGPLRVCTEGPVFDIRQILWRDDERRQYGKGNDRTAA